MSESHAKLKGVYCCNDAYAQARRTPQHCQTLLVKVSYDSRLWLLLALRLGRGD